MNINDFCEQLSCLSKDGAAVVLRSREEWHPVPPPSTVLFSEIGLWIADEFDPAFQAKILPIFNLIETAIHEGDEELTVAVATGLLEAFTNRLESRDASRLSVALQLLGCKSKQHVQAWLRF